ncbi:EutP/PduV family microcompartment system protein [Zhongshania borealis]
MTNTAQPALVDFVLVGAVRCGKTALMQALLGDKGEVLKTQAAVFHDGHVIDTPGEFIGRRSYYGALLSTIVDVSTIVYLQPANSVIFALPVGLLHVYPDKRVVGVISKIDLPDADVAAVSRLLSDNAIPAPHFATSVVTGSGVAELRNYLISLQGKPIDAAAPPSRSEKEHKHSDKDKKRSGNEKGVQHESTISQ